MSDQEINQAIAVGSGWKFEKLKCVSPDGEVFRGYPLANQICHAPNYAGDLNAMHDEEEWLTPAQKRIYAHKLRMKCGDDLLQKYDGEWSPIHANARQRAEAFLKTLGKWRE